MNKPALRRSVRLSTQSSTTSAQMEEVNDENASTSNTFQEMNKPALRRSARLSTQISTTSVQKEEVNGNRNASTRRHTSQSKPAVSRPSRLPSSISPSAVVNKRKQSRTTKKQHEMQEVIQSELEVDVVPPESPTIVLEDVRDNAYMEESSQIINNFIIGSPENGEALFQQPYISRHLTQAELEQFVMGPVNYDASFENAPSNMEEYQIIDIYGGAPEVDEAFLNGYFDEVHENGGALLQLPIAPDASAQVEHVAELEEFVMVPGNNAATFEVALDNNNVEEPSNTISNSFDEAPEFDVSLVQQSVIRVHPFKLEAITQNPRKRGRPKKNATNERPSKKAKKI